MEDPVPYFGGDEEEDDNAPEILTEPLHDRHFPSTRMASGFDPATEPLISTFHHTFITPSATPKTAAPPSHGEADPLVEDVPPPPPPLGLEKWQALAESAGQRPGTPTKRTIFSRFSSSRTLPKRKESTSSSGSSSSNLRSSPEKDEYPRHSLMRQRVSTSKSANSSISDITVIHNQNMVAHGSLRKSPSRIYGTLARIKKKTGKSTEDLRKLFPNFYISSWGSNSNSPSPRKNSAGSRKSSLTSVTSVGENQPHHERFAQKLRKDFLLNRSCSADRMRGGMGSYQPTGFSEGEQDDGHEEFGGEGKSHSRNSILETRERRIRLARL